MPSQVEVYTKQVLKVVVAQICQTIGWNSIHQSSLEVLVDTLDRFLQELTKQTYRITELYQRTEPTLDDLSLAFHYLNVNLSDIKEFIDYVGPPEHVPAVPKYPAAPPLVLNVKRQHPLSDDPYADPATIQPATEDSEDETQFAGFFQYNREYKTEITGGEANGTANGDVKKEDGLSGEENKTSAGGSNGEKADNKSDLRKLPANRIPSKRQLTMVQLTNSGKIQGLREGRLPGSDLPASVLSEIEPSADPPEPPKSSKSKSHKHQEASSSASSSKRDKLSQDPDKVKANIFKKIVHPPKSSPQPPPPSIPAPQPLPAQPAVPATSIPTPMEVIDIDSSPNPAPMLSPNPQTAAPPPPTSAKKEKKQRKNKEKPSQSMQLAQQQQSILSTLSSIPALPAGTTLEAIPMKREKERERDPLPPQIPLLNPFFGSNMDPDFNAAAAALFPSGPNFSLPQAPGLIPFGGIPNPLMPAAAVLGGLSKLPLFSQLSPNLASDLNSLITPSPPKKEKEPKKQKSQPTSLCNVPPLAPSNLFLPDTTVQVETVVKPALTPPPPVVAPHQAQAVPLAPLPPVSTIDLLTDEENDSGSAMSAAAAAAKKAEKAKKKEQRRLKKLLKSKKYGGEGGEISGVGGALAEDEPMDLSGLDQEKQRKLEKKLKKLQKSNKAKLKAEAAEEKAVSLRGSPEPLLLPKLTLKLNSPKMAHSPKELSGEGSAAAGGGGGGVREKHSSKDPYRPLMIDTNEMMTPVKRMKADALNSPAMRHEAAMAMPAEPELAKISPLVTRPMKQTPHLADLASPSPSVGRGRPKGSGKHQQANAALSAIPVKAESAAESSGPGSQVWICPACGSVDDGSPMIGCDGCDEWYHWICVGIHVAPDASEDWHCRVCISKRQEMAAGGGDMGLADLAARKKEKKRRKKEKRMKLDDTP